MKLTFAALLTLLIILINSQNSKAEIDNINDIDDYVDYLIKHKKPDDNVIVGNNIHDRVLINGKEISNGQNNKDHSAGTKYDGKESHKTEELSLWQRFKNWLSEIFKF
ncbi:uncharacterized protein LOC119609334 [Lucilia sericata]|uniref:uncharacterized protein LOC119609334 n=1 Tax=Lucilia sericata TaxID=13632 RepID=UPI0018A850FE|nr:uncharacterized protein LOC119609334 [Lucilia sericata]